MARQRMYAMSERTLPPQAFRNKDPVEIVVDECPILIRELSPTEYLTLVEQEFSRSSDGTTRAKGSYMARLIESCVLDPPIPDADELTVSFATRLATAIEIHHGGSDTTVKNGCGDKCTCSHLPTDLE